MKHILILLFILFLSTASKIESPDSLSKTKLENNLQQKTKVTESTNIDYKLLYENQKDYHKDLLSTVFWALGSILVVVLAIIGSNLYLNFRFNKKQYDNLVSEYEIKINDLEKILNEKVDQKIKKNQDESKADFSDYKVELTNSQGEKINEIYNGFKERLDSFSENLKEQILSVKDRHENLNKLVDKNAENIKVKLDLLENSFGKNLETESMKLKIDISEIEAEMWKSKGIFLNALFVYLDQSVYSIKVDWLWNLKYALRNIIEMLNKVKIVEERHYKLFDKLMPSIPDEYADNKSKIIELLKGFTRKE